MSVVARELLEKGMRRQLVALADAEAAGMKRLGWKIGINVPEIRESMNLPHPTVGWLDTRRAYCDGATVPLPAGGRLFVEPELAFRVGGTSKERHAPRFDAIAPALELIDYALPGAGLEAIVAHSMFHAGVVVGAFRGLPVPAGAGSAWPLVTVDGATSGTARNDLVPESPQQIAEFVDDYLRAFGACLVPGDVVLSGSFFPRAVPLGSGSEVRAEFGNLGVLSVRAA